MKTFEWTAPSGVKVVSSVAPVEDKWWDSVWLHWIWSYGSWGSMILMSFGYPGLRVYLAKRGWWGKPSEKKIAESKALR